MEATLVLEALNRALGHRQIEPTQHQITPIKEASNGLRPTGSC